MTRPSRRSEAPRANGARPALESPAPGRRDAGRALLELTMASRLDELDAVVAAVVAACRAAGAGEQPCRFTIPLVVTEVLANAIERGNGNDAARRVHVSLRRAHRRLLLEVRDEGSGFDLSACRGTPGLTAVREAEGGRGLFIVCALTEHVESMSTPAGGLVRVTFKPS